MRKMIVSVFVVVAFAMGQTTKPQETFTNRAVITAIIAMEKEYRTAVPSGLTSAQASAATKARDEKIKEILDGLRAMPAGSVDFVVDDVIHHAPSTPSHEGGVEPSSILRLNQTLQNRENDKQTAEAMNGEYEIVGHIDWKTALVKSPDNRPVQKIRILTWNSTVAKWKVSERHTLPVTCSSIDSTIHNIKEEYGQASSGGGRSVQLKKTVDNSAAYVGLVMKMHEVAKP